MWKGTLRFCRETADQVNRQLKSQLFRLLAWALRPRGSREPPSWQAGQRRVLFLQYHRIGDMILATGIIRAIVAAQPTVTVDVLASFRNAAVLDGNPNVGTVITMDKKRPLSMLQALVRIRRARYDAVLDTMVLTRSLTNMLLMWGSGARYLIGVAGRGNDYALTLPVARVSEAAHHIDLSAALLAAFGVEPRSYVREGSGATPAAAAPAAATDGISPITGWGVWLPEIYLSAAELGEGERRWLSTGALRTGPRAARRLVVNVSAGSTRRHWPDERFITVLTWLRARFPHISLLLIGAAEDSERMTRIAGAAGVPVAHTPHYREMMAIVAASDFVFTPDTSVTHVASAFRKPVVVMFPAGEGACFGPYGTTGWVVSTPMSCSDSSLKSLQVEPVMQALAAVIDPGAQLPYEQTRPEVLSGATVEALDDRPVAEAGG